MFHVSEKGRGEGEKRGKKRTQLQRAARAAVAASKTSTALGHIFCFPPQALVFSKSSVKKRVVPHLLPVLLQGRHRGEIPSVMDELEFLENTVIRQHIHF